MRCSPQHERGRSHLPSLPASDVDAAECPTSAKRYWSSHLVNAGQCETQPVKMAGRHKDDAVLDQLGTLCDIKLRCVNNRHLLIAQAKVRMRAGSVCQSEVE